jgi:[ribosomal protein S5]-alanine N-acetyltransferase
MTHKIILETANLSLRELTLQDWEFTKRLVNSDGWLAYIGDRKVTDQATAEEYLRSRYIQSYADHGYSMWLVTEKASNEPIGMCGLIKRANLPDTDIGFAFLPEYAGKGYGKESAAAVIKYGFDTLHLTKIIAITMGENKPSRALCRSIGMKLEGETDFDGEWLLVYARGREV